MSADNFVVIRKMKDNTWWWGEFRDSDYDRDLSDDEFTEGPFNSDNEAVENVENVFEGEYLEYVNCLYRAFIGAKV